VLLALLGDDLAAVVRTALASDRGTASDVGHRRDGRVWLHVLLTLRIGVHRVHNAFARSGARLTMHVVHIHLVSAAWHASTDCLTRLRSICSGRLVSPLYLCGTQVRL
jgi:hypothetical protein